MKKKNENDIKIYIKKKSEKFMFFLKKNELSSIIIHFFS